MPSGVFIKENSAFSFFKGSSCKKDLITSCTHGQVLFLLFPPLRWNLWGLWKEVSNLNLGIYSQLCPAAPRRFCHFLRGGAGRGRTCFSRGGAGRGSLFFRGAGRASLVLDPKKLISQPREVQNPPNLTQGTLTQYILRLVIFRPHPTPPICLKMPKCAKFCTFGESRFKHNPKVGVYREKF